MKIYEIGTGYTPIPAQIAAATESVVEELTKAFLDLGHEAEIIDIVTPNRADTKLPIREVKVPFFITQADVSLGILHKVKRVVYSIALAFYLKKMICEEKDKVILHFHNQYNLFFFLKLVSPKVRENVRIAYTNHNGYWSLPWEQARDTIQKRYFQEEEAMKHADIVFVLNPRMKHNIVQHIGIPEEKVILIANGVNTDTYHPLEEEEIRKIKESFGLGEKKVILQVGSINENKGQLRSLEKLLPLLQKDENLAFAYAGEIVSEEYYQKLTQRTLNLECRKQVIYLGAMKPGEEMNHVYNVADVMIFASEFEGFPLVCVESLAAGVPVLLYSDAAPDFGIGCVKLQSEEQTWQLLHNRKKLTEIKTAARDNAAENFTWKKIAGNYASAMENTARR